MGIDPSMNMDPSITPVSGGASAETQKQQAPAPTKGFTQTDSASQADQSTATSEFIAENPKLAEALLDLFGVGLTAADMVQLIVGALNTARRQKTQDEILQALVQAGILTIPPPKQKAGGGDGDKKPSKPQQPTTMIVSQTTLGSTTSLEVYETIRQRLGRPPRKISMDQIMNQVERVGSLTSFYSSLPVVQRLGDPKFLDSTDPKVALAINTARQEFVQKLVNSEEIDRLAVDLVKDSNGVSRDEQLTEDLQKQAEVIAASIKTGLLKDSVERLGAALNAPGLAVQVFALTKVPKDVVFTLDNENTRKSVVDQLAGEAAKSGSTTKENAERRILAALQDALKQGRFNTEDDLRTALRDALKQQFDNNQELADTLSKLALQIASNIKPPPPPDLRGERIKEEVVRESIEKEIIKEGIQEDDAKKAAIQIASLVASRSNNGEFRTFDDIDKFVIEQLKNEVGETLSDQKRKEIAVKVDFGIPRTVIDYPGFAGNITQAELRTHVEKRLDDLGVTERPFREEVFIALGLAPPTQGNSIVDAVNENYEKLEIPEKFFLSFDGYALIKEQMENREDPSFFYSSQLWAPVMAGIPLEPGTEKPIDIQV